MAKKDPVELLWHPDFRDKSHLPDIKPVRSIFFINFVSYTLVLILSTYWLFLEWRAGSLNQLILADQEQINFRKKSNDDLLRQSKEFERWAKIINEIQGFVGVAVKPSQFLTAMGEARPARMTMSQISYNIETRQETKEEKGKKVSKPYNVYSINIAGSVSGASQTATRAVEAFRDKLETLDLFKNQKLALKPTLKTFERNKSLDIYTFNIVMEVRL